MSQLLSGVLQCCSSHNEAGSELQVVQLSSDALECRLAQPPHHGLMTQQDPFDAMVTPRASGRRETATASQKAASPRRRNLRDRIWLPKLRRYPVAPTCSADDPEEMRRAELLRLFRDFVMDLHRGIHLTQLNTDNDYADVHCQILEDLQTLKVDQGSGSIFEFPLASVSKAYLIVKSEDRWYGTGGLPSPSLGFSSAEHVVVLEFMRRKLPFMFDDIKAAQRFLMFLELLIRRALEAQHETGAATRCEGSGSFRNGSAASISPLFSGLGGASQPRQPTEPRCVRPLLPLFAAAERKKEDGPMVSPAEEVETPLCACQPPAI